MEESNFVTVHVVGVGALGSTISEEIAKRANALEIPVGIRLYDFDDVEPRNVVAQNFCSKDVGKPKAQVIADKLKGYSNVDAYPIVQKITEENVHKVIGIQMDEDHNHIIIDSVDNIPTRHVIWSYCMAMALPVLHSAMSFDGDGYVQWTFRTFDSFSLSPMHMSQKQNKSKQEKEEEPVSLPPCQLSSFRSLIFNTSIATVNALFIYSGFDIANELLEVVGEGSTEGMMTHWMCTDKSILIRKELIGVAL
jgi:hypothetical protein